MAGALNYDWANVVKAEVSKEEAEGKPRKPVAPGMYPARVTNVEITTTKGGAFGVWFEYSIEDGAEKDRTIREFVCLKKKDGTVAAFGGQKLKRRLMQFGFTPEKVDTFKFPKKENETGDFKHVYDAEVTIETTLETIANGEAAGLVTARVSKVFPRKKEAA